LGGCPASATATSTPWMGARVFPLVRRKWRKPAFGGSRKSNSACGRSGEIVTPQDGQGPSGPSRRWNNLHSGLRRRPCIGSTRGRPSGSFRFHRFSQAEVLPQVPHLMARPAAGSLSLVDHSSQPRGQRLLLWRRDSSPAMFPSRQGTQVRPGVARLSSPKILDPNRTEHVIGFFARSPQRTTDISPCTIRSGKENVIKGQFIVRSSQFRTR